MKEKLFLYAQFVVWIFWRKKTIRNKQTQVMCPLMLKYGNRFKGTLLFCDIPQTRTYFCEGKETPCATWKDCLPRQKYVDKASDELNCRPTYTRKTSIHFES